MARKQGIVGAEGTDPSMHKGENSVNKMSLKLMLSAASLALPASLMAQAIPESQQQNPWFGDGQQNILNRLQSQAQLQPEGRAKNVVLFVGDGMGIPTLTAARILGGQRAGGSGEQASLSFEDFPNSAWVKTYNVDAQIPDSAGTMTAMMSGVKTNAGVVGVNANVSSGNCLQQPGNELVSALDLAEIKGLATGVVSNTRITHATPAATYAKSASRAWESNAEQSADVVEQGCEDIASQLINFEQNLETAFPNADVNGIDVVLGGGRRSFLPADATADLTATFGQATGARTDGRNLIDEWQQRYPAGRYLFDEATLDALDTEASSNVMGLFSDSHMQYEADRAANAGQQPSLSKMVGKAIELLDNNPNGFLLVVEAGRVDHAHHAGNAHGALDETLELSRAVQAAVNMTSVEDTLILVTADHSHVMTFAGYPARGNPILGKVVSQGGVSPALAEDGLPYTTLGYANGPGFRDYGNNTNPDRTYQDAVLAGRQDLNAVDTQEPGFHQESLVPLAAETHGGEDVSVHAVGPGAYRVHGTMEQNVIFHVMDKALGLTQ